MPLKRNHLVNCLCVALIAIGVMYILNAELGFYLIGGWLSFLGQVLPRVRFRLDGILFCLVGFAVSVGLLHWLAKWFLEASAKARGRQLTTRWRVGHSVALVSLFLMMFVIVIAIAGITHQVGWLIRSPIHWYASPIQSDEDNQLSGYRIGVIDPKATGKNWLAIIAPFMSVSIEDSDDKLPWNDPRNVHEYRKVNPQLFNPRAEMPHKSPDGMGLSHFAGSAAILKSDKPQRLKALDVSDTILVGEINQALEPWGMAGNCRNVNDGLNVAGPKKPGAAIGFGTPGPGGVTIFGMLDLSVRSISNDIDPEVLRQLGKVKEAAKR